MENFGKTKVIDDRRMRVISAIPKDYDIIAVQEISNVHEMADPGCPRNENSCPGHPNCNLVRNALERYLNQEHGLNYKFVFTPQVKDERYLYIYNTDKVSLEQYGLMDDPVDSLPICALKPENKGKMVRQPFRATFKAPKFDFVLLTVHTRPKVNIQELERLEYFYREAEKQGEPDVIILGDLNADCRTLKPADAMALRRPEYIWVVSDDSDTTVSPTDCAYDRFIFKGSSSEDFSGNWGIYKNIAENISDHYLIWPEFWKMRDTDNCWTQEYL
ncbi:MAG: endonuclease/exonuclease/phosphatase family protein [Candidatus Hodarchaeota archaeon]